MRNKITIAIFLLLAIFITGCSATANAVATANSDTKSTFEINADEITSQVSFFTYNHEGTDIKFFAVRGSDGDIRTAFDACDVCGGSKGYTQRGNDIVCNTCGKVFKIDSLGTENKGYGCWPSYLEHQVKGNKIIINTEDLIAEQYKFQ